MERWLIRTQKIRTTLECIVSLSFVLMVYANWRTNVDGESLDWAPLWFMWGIGFLVLLFMHKMLRATVQRTQLPRFSGDKWNQLSLLNSEIEKMQEIVDLRNRSSGRNSEEEVGCFIYALGFFFGVITVGGFLVHEPNSFDSVGLIWVSFNLMVLAFFFGAHSFHLNVPSEQSFVPWNIFRKKIRDLNSRFAGPTITLV